MEVRCIYLINDKAPVSGTALYVVLDDAEVIRKHFITLLHPHTLTKFDITLDEFHEGCNHVGDAGKVWPINLTGLKFDRFNLAELLERKAKFFAAKGRQFPSHAIRQAIAYLRGIDIMEIPHLKETVVRSAPTKTAKRPGVVNKIEELLHIGHTIEEMVKILHEEFPDRGQDGMKTTVRCQINRLPAKVGQKVIRVEDKKRGSIFIFEKKPAPKPSKRA